MSANWEGVCVKPDVVVRADLALATAQLLALKGRAEKAKDPDQQEELRQALLDARAQLHRLEKEKARR